MKKVIYLAMSLLTLNADLHAQPKIDKSEVFSEPLSEGYTKMLLLKNGNTFYIHYGGKRGLEVMVWDKNKKSIGTTKIAGKNWNSSRKRNVRICGTYEINGEPVVFLAYSDLSDPPTLVRIRLNAQTGALAKEEVVGKMPKIKFLNSLFAYKDEVMQELYVEKDPASDYYAVVFFNRSSKKMDERIKVLHFDGAHKLINTAYYNNPDPAFKKLNYIGSVVDGDKRVFLSTYGAENSKGKNASVFIGCLKKEDSVFSNKPLDFTEDFRNTHSDMVFDRDNNTVIMLTNTVAANRGNRTSYVSFLSYIGADDLLLKNVNVVGNEKTNDYAHNTLGIKNMDYTGIPQRLVLNNDNSVTVLQEEMTFVTIKSSKGGTVAEYTYLGNVGITEIGRDGKERAGFTLMKKQLYTGIAEPMTMAGISKGKWDNGYWARRSVNDNQFMSYEYIHTPKCNYVLFCDNPKNDKKEETKKKRKLTMDTDHINTICYSLKDGVATRSYLFGEPQGKRNTIACYIGASHYDKTNNVYTTVVSEQHGRKYESRVAWIHFD